ncbi:DUF6701 domain-containing protein [Massilia niabensis]|uniref:DUF6701 domain-containing protein n=1 Tax=Massilia niabensis TaxID=544910 RepID=A0ABW0L479_9BURK
MIGPVVRACAALVLFLALLPACAPAFADTELSLHKTVSGSVNFTGTQVSLRKHGNAKDACAVSPPKANQHASLVVPPNSTVLWAQLYWAGSGAPDNTVSFEGKTVTATRKYTSNTVGNGMAYFGGAADVTAAVKARMSGTYSFSGLTVSNGRPWCDSQAVLGAFALLVVYSNPAEPERVLNLYEGFRHLQNSSVTLTASNFRWPKLWKSRIERARIGHITWEGDANLLSDGERLIFQGDEVTDDMNAAGNQFNSKSNINRDSASYGVDFDAYDTTVVIGYEDKPTVTTTYHTGQDLVLLNAEILVLPTMPVSDLSLEMSRGGVMEVGQNTAYTIVVANHGPFTEAGDVTVVDTLPAGMSFVSGSGTNWTCAASGQVVTCSYKGALAPGTSAPPLTIMASVNQAGTMTNTAQVTGTADQTATNNSDSETATATASSVGSAGYAFTSVACVPGKKLGSSDCPRYTATVTGAATAKIYVTAVNGDTAVALDTKKETVVSMQFSQSCVNPAATAQVKALYAEATLPACTEGGAVPAAGATAAWSAAVGMRFAADSASAAVVGVQSNFVYADVGVVGLNLLANGRAASTQFISRPAQLGIRRITNRAGVAAPENPTVSGPGLARAGEDVVVFVGALLDNGSYAPNFGNEKVVPAVVLVASIPADVRTHMPSDGVLSAPQIVSHGQGAIGLGVAYSEVGIISLLPSLTDYLTTGRVDGQGKSAGRFYPGYFNTVAAAPMPCLAAMVCPEAPNNVSGAVYSGQPFNVTVTAFNMQGVELDNYVGPWRKPVTLTAVSAPGGGAAPRLLANGALGLDGAGVPRLEGTPHYAFDPATAFSADTPAANNWIRPAAVYVRATATEATVGGDRTVTSRRVDDISAEDGVMVLGGRLNVGSAQGVATARTPMRLQTEYWTGAAWVAHNALEDTAVEPGQAAYSRCLLGLRRSGAALNDPNNCNLDIVGSASTGPINLVRGAGIFWFRAPGAGRNGSAWVEMRGPGWLPSTRGRISFGAARRPLIYVREAY